MQPSLRPHRTFFLLITGTLVVFAALLLVLSLTLRSRLHEQVLRREASAIDAVARMQVSTAEAQLRRLRMDVTAADVFAAVLDSSRLSGVLAVQLFDTTGTLRDALPPVPSDAPVSRPWWPPSVGVAEQRYHARGSLEDIFGITPEPGTEPTRTPLLEVIVPLPHGNERAGYGSARYWIDGQSIEEEFGRIDRGLAAQAGIAFAGGGVLIILLVGWAFQRLARAQAQLIAQSEDLVRANQELDFAAKTGALGAISAHLIHGLRNPLAGLEGFVAEASTSGGRVAGEAQQTAIETARRLRAMVNDVVSVLRDEASGGADYPIPLPEIVDAVCARMNALATTASVELKPVVHGSAAVKARTANLAGLVLANLLTNAIEASSRGGSITFTAEAGGEQVHFSIADNGSGLPPQVRESLFRPVVSSKSGGGGMGLAISHRLARHAGGELKLVRSNPDGTVFRLSIPAEIGAPVAHQGTAR